MCVYSAESLQEIVFRSVRASLNQTGYDKRRGSK